MTTSCSVVQWRTLVCTTLALVAFAANSLLCRLALGSSTIDPASFSTIRLVSGAITLAVIMLSTRRQPFKLAGSWASTAALLLYAVPFSFAYISLSTGTGALILFGVVQTTMIASAMASGERPHFMQWSGMVLALLGLIYLVSPGLHAPSPVGSGLMAIAGIAWGAYSLRGRRATDPLAETAGNFSRAVPPLLVLNIATLRSVHLSSLGVQLAILSGAVASGLGYVIWYTALAGLTKTRAATVQLAVPVLAAIGGIMFLGEDVSLRLAISAAMILGGVGLTLAKRE